MAKAGGFWLPMMDVFNLGVPGPSGHENDTYVSEYVIYKVNNLLNSGSIVALLRKIVMHNLIFPDTAYAFHAFAGFDGRTVQPVIIQPRIANARPATQIMIDTYMAALGFQKTNSVGRYVSRRYEVWDLVPRNVLVDEEGDIFVAMSDGCPHASADITYNNDWKREDIAQFVADMSLTGYTAKVLCTMLVDECDKLYGYHPLDDATAAVVRIRKRVPMNILFGPPADPDDCNKMMSLFFSKEGKRIICGGTTASIAAKYLRKPLVAKAPTSATGGVPPISELEGADLVTEGVITMSKVLEYAQDYLQGNESYEDWNYGHDGASRICQLLFEEATDINFYVGRAMNPAHQNPDLPINFNIKMNIVKELASCLEQMGKTIRVSYF